MTLQVHLAEYQASWKDIFAREERLLRECLGTGALAVEHFGSTAVEGMVAKPIVDILLGVAALPLAPEMTRKLTQLGYSSVPEMALRFPGLEYFHKGPPEWRLVHLHVVEHRGAIWLRSVRFRDYLRDNPEVARKYALLKRRLAKKYPHDRSAYTEGKRSFIDHVVLASPQCRKDDLCGESP